MTTTATCTAKNGTYCCNTGLPEGHAGDHISRRHWRTLRSGNVYDRVTTWASAYGPVKTRTALR
ncbi:MAG: hypothetical protein ACRDTJ_22005 [Pseudonocardiaceae bacterium]